MTLNYRLDENVTISAEVEDSDKLIEFLKYFNEMKPYLIRENFLQSGHKSADAGDKPSKPATERQKETMIKYRIPFSDDITSAEAHRLIDESIKSTKQKE